IEHGVLRPYLGNYSQYRTRRRPIVLEGPSIQAKSAEKSQSVATKSTGSTSSSSSKRNAKGKIRTVEEVERDIEKAEASLRELAEELAVAALKAEAEQLTQLSADYELARARVEELLGEWERLAEVP